MSEKIKADFDEMRQSQLPAIELLLAMGYSYISADDTLRERGGDTRNFILADIAAEKLMEINGYEVDGKEYKFNEGEVRDAIEELEHIQYEGLIDTSQKIYNIIMPTSGGKTIKVNVGGKSMSKNFRFIDFKHPENNSFHITAEFRAEGKQSIRPDIVCFVNGIPFAVIENKKSGVPDEDGVNQQVRNQGPEYCPKLFTYTQLLVGTNGQVFKYGTTGTPAKFYSVWKEKGITEAEIDRQIKELIAEPIDEGVYEKVLNDLGEFNDHIKSHKQKLKRKPKEQDRGIFLLFRPERLLDLTKNHILFDAGIKKISRYQQYFAVNKMLKRIEKTEVTKTGLERRPGGLVWHTQGSGKSLTMVMFVKALIEDPHIINPRVIVVTDRKDLEKQIRDTFKACNIKKEVEPAKSGQHLLKLIKEKNLAVITAIIDKFDSASKDRAGFVDDDENIFVLIDEAHRSQSGIANLEMNRTIPNACYIGFTGTPLMKENKESWKKFGGYIDKYTIDDALADNVILPLVYEGRYAPMEQNAKQIDRQTDRLTKDMSEKQKQDIQRHISAKIIRDNHSRITEIGHDIEAHFTKHFQNTGLKAQLVAPSKYSAVLFQEFFAKQGKINTAVVISDEHDDGNETDTHKAKVVQYLKGVKDNHSSVGKYEKDVIESFKHNYEDGVELIIVVDKLLTGFDAPCNTVLYLAKDLRDHNLLQAIARVNRLHENKKTSKKKTLGYIIDYSENAKNINTAMKLFGNYDDEDVRGTLIDVGEKIKELEESYSQLHGIFKAVGNSSDDEEFMQFLADEPTRQSFYKQLNDFIRNFNECFVLQDFVHEFAELDVYKRELKKFMELRKSASLQYADRVNLADYKQSLRNILDGNIKAQEVELLTKQVNITDKKNFDKEIENIGSDKSKAEAIAAQTEREIKEKMDSDPEFYTRFSEKISEILKKMRANKMEDIDALKQLKLISNKVIDKNDGILPEKIEFWEGSDVFYRNLKKPFAKFGIDGEEYVCIVVDIFDIVRKEAIIDWHKNLDVKRKIKNRIDDYLYDVIKVERQVELSSNDINEIIETTLTLAENNYDIFS